MTFTIPIRDQQGFQAIDINHYALALSGSGVVSGCGVSINSGSLGATDTLSVASGTIKWQGSNVSVNAQSAGLSQSSVLPRKDVVYVDNSGTVSVEPGGPEAADPSAETGIDTERPSPPDFDGFEGVPVAEVWIAADSSQVNSGDIYDRRMSPITGVDTSADYTLSGTWDFSDLRARGPVNLDNLQYDFWGGTNPAVVVRGELVMQMGDDTAAAGASGGATMFQFVTQSGERIGTLSADREHNHIGFYTRAQAFDGTDYQPEKRFNIQGGAAEVNADFYTIDEHIVRGSNPYYRLVGETGSSPAYTISEVSGQLSTVLQWDSASSKTTLQSYDGSGVSDVLRLDAVNGEVEANSNDIVGAGNVSLVDGSGGLDLPVHTSAPSSPSTGKTVVQDGTSWDPAGTGQEEVVCYLNGVWTALS